MKDYSMNEEERKYFIKKYRKDKKRNKIIAYFANRVKHNYPDNEQYEGVILKKMEDQVKGSDGCLKKYGNKKLRSKALSVVFTGICVLTGTLLGFCVPADNVALIMANGLFFTTGIGSLIFTGVYIDAKLMLNDLEKNRYFIENKDKINSNIGSENILAGTSIRTQNMVKNAPGLTVNNIDKLPKADLCKMCANVGIENKLFGFVYNGQPNNENGYIEQKKSKGKAKVKTPEIRD